MLRRPCTTGSFLVLQVFPRPERSLLSGRPSSSLTREPKEPFLTRSLADLAAALADRYRIERELGAGGMATVYLAADLKHDRKVAIKVLKPELAAVLGAERFVQEIKTTAALSHPHILPLFDSGQAAGFLYYVMPYIEGETIRDRLNRETQLGVEEAVRITVEVADALDYAHRHGVIHRDIKPENLLLHDGRPMVMDFGIALAVSAAAGGRMTETGLSLGTPHYMSPEQATADKEITARSDVYSLASVLFEMLAGVPPHEGGSAQQVIMRIIAEPAKPVTELRKSVPPNVAAALARALEKVPADRFATAKAFAEALQNPAFTTAGVAAGGRAAAPAWYRSPLIVGLGVVSIGLAVALAAVLWRAQDAPSRLAPAIQFPLSADPAVRVGTRYTRPFAVSPDGRTIVFRASTDSTEPQLWVRQVGDPDAHPLAGTDGAMNPAISPDGGWVAFVDGRALRKVRLAGGEISTLATIGTYSAALAWVSNDEILFEQLGAGTLPIERVSAAGGQPTPAVSPDSSVGETWLRRPFVVPGSDVVVYASAVERAPEGGLSAYRLSDGRRAHLGIPGIGALGYLDGHLIYSRVDGTLMAVPFEASALRAGAPVELSPRVFSNGSIGTAVGLSSGGTLVYQAAATAARARLELVDTTGKTVPLRGQFSLFDQPPRFSPNGRLVAVADGRSGQVRRGQNPSGDLWVVEVATGVATRLTTDGSVSAHAWMPDGRHLVFVSAGSRGRRSVRSPWTAASRRSNWPARLGRKPWSPSRMGSR